MESGQSLCGDFGAEPSVFYHIEQGTYGMPGKAPAIYLLDAAPQAESQDMQKCLWQRDDGGALTWDVCGDPESCKRMDCHLQGYEAEGTSDAFFLRRSGSNGSMDGTSTYVQAPEFDVGDGAIVRMNASRTEAGRLAAVCLPCPGKSLGASGMVLCAVIVLAAMLPMLGYLYLSCSRREPAAASPLSWPRRQRSRASYVVLQLGWCLAIFGLAPSLLWSAGNWWTGDVASYYPLVPLGFLAMLLAVRPDDSVTLIRSISALSMIVLVVICVIFVTDAVRWFSFTGPEVWQQPGLRRYGVLRIFTSASICFVTAGFSIMQLPVHGCRVRSLRWKAISRPSCVKSSSDARLRQFWASIRGTLLIGLLLTVMINMALSFSLGGRPSSADGSSLALAISLLVVYALTSPFLRLKLHLGRWRLIQVPCSSPSPELSRVVPGNAASASLEVNSGPNAGPNSGPNSAHSTAPSLASSTWDVPWSSTWDGDVSSWESSEISEFSMGELAGRGTFANVVRKRAARSPDLEPKFPVRMTLTISNPVGAVPLHFSVGTDVCCQGVPPGCIPVSNAVADRGSRVGGTARSSQPGQDLWQDARGRPVAGHRDGVYGVLPP